MIKRFRRLPRWGKAIVGILGAGLTVLCGFVGLSIYSQTQSNSVPQIRRWFNDTSSRDELITYEACKDAPFILPTQGFIGLLWNDPAGPYNLLHRHSGIDIFGDGEPGKIPVRAAYDGYLTRNPDWVSAVIIRHEDPLQDGRMIWTYYAHMASGDGDSYIPDRFPPGSIEVFVERGEIIGYQGEYNGPSLRPIGLHLHFSIVLSDDNGSFRNETDSSNTLDPSPYLGMNVNIDDLPERPIRCSD